MTATGTVAWFDLTKQFGFVALSNGYGDAFLHMSVLKQAGYVWLPRGTTVRVRIEAERGKQRVAEVLEIDQHRQAGRERADPAQAQDLNALGLSCVICGTPF